MKLESRATGGSFKPSPLGSIPEDWEVVRLESVVEIVSGTTPSTNEETYWDPPEVVWVTPADMDHHRFMIRDSARRISRKALQECNLTLLPERSVLLSTRAPVGYVALVETPLTFNQGCKGLIPDHEKISPEFLVYYLKKITNILESLSGGSTFRELGKSSLANLPIPLPPLPEQKKIAEILMTVDRKLELLRREKEHLQRLKKGLMDDLLTGRRRLRVEES